VHSSRRVFELVSVVFFFKLERHLDSNEMLHCVNCCRHRLSLYVSVDDIITGVEGVLMLEVRF
jgi:hypothetical protein